MAAVSTPWTVGCPSCICQPANGVPSYSMISLNRGMLLADRLATEIESPQKRRGGHRSAPGPLNFEQACCPDPTGDIEGGVQHGSGHPATVASGAPQHLDAHRRAAR